MTFLDPLGAALADCFWSATNRRDRFHWPWSSIGRPSSSRRTSHRPALLLSSTE